MSKSLKFVLTGTGRCGTVFAARLLTSAGIPCSHEGIFTPFGFAEALRRLNSNSPETSEASKKDGNWLAEVPVAESSYMAAPYLSYIDAKIVHLIRHPLKVARSFLKDASTFSNSCPDHQKIYQKFIYTNLPHLPRIKDEIGRICEYVVDWNNLISSHSPDIVIRIEYDIPKLLEFIQAEHSENLFKDTKANSWRSDDEELTLDDIPDGSIKNEFISFMKEYDYE